MGSVIAEALAGKRIAITGSTGFVGTALVERLLRCVPDCELVLLVRDGKRTPAARRVERELLKNDAFDRLRAPSIGAEAFDEVTARRITTIAGDVGTDGLGLADADRDVLASCDIVIHSAATVSFDSPLDSAVEINLLGPTRIAQLLQRARRTPHLVSVSTCYVAGNRRGTAPEELVSAGPFDLGLNWRTEVAAARRLRGDAEAASRQPDQLAEFRKRRPHRARRRRRAGAGGQDRAAARAVGARPAGRGRAGAGGQRRLARRLRLHEGARRAGADGRRRATCRSSIVRPSIIESALAEPRPGWIRGFRMAEPVLISYARGLLREFPGVPEGTSTSSPSTSSSPRSSPSPRSVPRRHPAITQVASGGINPLKYRVARRQRQRLVHASTRSTTPRASRSSSRSSASPAVAGCRPARRGPSR